MNRCVPRVLALSLLLGSPALALGQSSRAKQVLLEGQPVADLGNGTYRNPVLAGHYHDPTVVRVGADYYMTHCPDLVMWHSRDLVNWEPIGRVNFHSASDVWAPELTFHHGRFYLYLPVRIGNDPDHLRFTNVVLTADTPAGPWSQPTDLGIGGIDPGHVVGQDGSRWLYVNNGRMVPLTPDGLHVHGTLATVYAGWPIPADWITECQCLESPKFFWRDQWLYYVSAEGGTSGPSTSHMVVVARSRSPAGPWQNDPQSPLLHTRDRKEPWWSQGHGTILDAPDGSWWMLFHAVENGRRELGRETLLLPIQWTADGWPRIPEGITAASILRKPPGENVGHGLPLSDEFPGRTLGLQWRDRDTAVKVDDGNLQLSARGAQPSDAAQISLTPTAPSYDVSVEVTLNGADEAGVLITGPAGRAGETGVGLRREAVTEYVRGRGSRGELPFRAQHAFLRIRNLNGDVGLYFGTDGAQWTKLDWGADVSGHDVLRVALFATGHGTAQFRHFVFRALPSS